MKLYPRLMKKAMSQFGISQEGLKAKQVRIVLEGKELVFENPDVLKIKMGGEVFYQISGNPVERYQEPPDEDVKTVMEKAGVSREEALKALKENNLDIAAAIISLQK